MKMEQFLQGRNMKVKCLVQIAPTWTTLAQERRSFCHTVTSKLVKSWIKEEELRHQLRFLDACHQARNHQEKRRRMKQRKRHQPMAEEEMDFEAGDMQRNSLLRRLMWKRTSERRLLTLVIAALTCYEFGNVHVQRAEYRPLPWLLCVWESRHFKYWKTDGPPFFLTHDVLFLLLLLPSSSSRSIYWFALPFFDGLASALWYFQPREEEFPEWCWKKERADKRKADQKARKAKGKAKARSCSITSIRKDNFNDCCERPIRIDDGFQWRHLLLLSRLSYAASERSWLCLCRYHQVW